MAFSFKNEEVRAELVERLVEIRRAMHMGMSQGGHNQMHVNERMAEDILVAAACVLNTPIGE